MAEEKKEPKLTIPSGMYPYQTAQGEVMVELTTVPGKPSYPLEHPNIEAGIVQHLNKTGDTLPNRIRVVKALLRAKGVQNGVRETSDLYEEPSLVIALVLYVREHPEGFNTNTLEIRAKLVEFATTKKLDTSDWRTGLNWFSRFIDDNRARLRKYGIVAKRVSDGNRSWQIKPDATDATDAPNQEGGGEHGK